MTGWPTASNMRRTCRFRPSWIVSSIRPGREAAHGRWGGRAVVELDAVRETREVALVEIAVDGCDVRLLDAVARVRERVRERAVVREEQRAGRVDVEAADRDDARVARDDVDDGAPSLRVARRRDVADGLVEQQVREPLRRDLDAVDLDPVGLLDEGVEPAGLAVHADAAGLDQVVGLPARGDAGAGEVGVQAHG